MDDEGINEHKEVDEHGHLFWFVGGKWRKLPVTERANFLLYIFRNFKYLPKHILLKHPMWCFVITLKIFLRI